MLLFQQLFTFLKHAVPLIVFRNKSEFFPTERDCHTSIIFVGKAVAYICGVPYEAPVSG